MLFQPRVALAAPVVTSFNPLGGPSGTLVSIGGTGFTGATGVRFNGRSTSFSVFSDTQITATVPASATTGPISVTTASGTGTSATNFFVGSPPTVSGLSPNYGSPGASITINGTNLTGATSVTFGGQAATFTVLSATQISATVPPDAVTGYVTVGNPAGTGTSSTLFYLPPIITGFTPAGAPIGSEVAISGTGFDIANGVTFGGVGASFFVSSNNVIYAYVPSGAPTGLITVSSPAGSGSSAVSFFVGYAPSISSFTPSGGPVGTEVTINGSGFDGVSDVMFSGIAASFVVDNYNQIRATVPAGATAGVIAITNPSGTGTSATEFFVGALPAITLVSPPFGPVGAPVDISGSGFTGVTQVDFNGTNAVFTIVNDGMISTSIPTGATTGFLNVVNPAGSASTAQVFGISPSITTFDPSCVASLYRDTTHVVILGTNFTGATSVRLNDISTAFTVDSDQKIRCSIPAGDVNGLVSVVTPYGTAVSAGSFRLVELQPPPRVPGQTWPRSYTQNVAVTTGTGSQSWLVSVSDGVGGVIEVWQEHKGESWDIYAQRINAYGAIATGWPTGGLPIATGPGDQMSPTAAADGAGGVLIAWQDSRSGAWDIYAQHIMSDGTFETTWPVNGLAICTDGSGQFTPAIAVDKSCGAFIAWLDYRNGPGDIYAQHVTALGAIAEGWSSQGNPICTVGGEQAEPTIASDGFGGALIAWRDSRWSNQPYVQRVRAEGTIAPGWPVGGMYASDYCCAQYEQQVAADGAGGAYVIWRDNRCNTHIFMQHLTATGTFAPGWSTSGNPVNSYCRYGTSEEARVMYDGSGGAYVCWGERTSYGQSDIMVQRFVSNGSPSPGWPSGGLRATSDPNDQTSPEMTTDGYGGVIVSWRETRSGNADIYSQRIMSNGTVHPAWVANGMRVSTNTSDQVEPTIVPALNNNAIVSWRDSREGNYRAYAQLIDGAGRLGDAAPQLESIADVGGDQGGNIRIKWGASYLDSLPTLEIASYGVWRQVDASVVSAAMKSGAKLMTPASAYVEEVRPGSFLQLATASGTTYWEGLTSIPARGQPVYSYVASTFVDSTATGNPFTTYMVDAHAATFPYYWTSWSDSGYSVDNLPPGQPQGFVLAPIAGGIKLHWNPRTERDMAGYRLYRGTTTDFVPATENLITSTTDTTYTDASGNLGFHYKLLAVDVHGNPSLVAAIHPGSGVDAELAIPTALSLSPAIPNPIREQCVFRLGIPARQRVSLTIFDLQGRVVRRIVDDIVEAGQHTIKWDGRDGQGQPLSSGVYLSRVQAGPKTISGRVVISR